MDDPVSRNRGNGPRFPIITQQEWIKGIQEMRGHVQSELDSTKQEHQAIMDDLADKSRELERLSQTLNTAEIQIKMEERKIRLKQAWDQANAKLPDLEPEAERDEE